MDPETIGVYDARHEDYASRFGDKGPSDSLQAFAGSLSAGQRVLDLAVGRATPRAAWRQWVYG